MEGSTPAGHHAISFEMDTLPHRPVVEQSKMRRFLIYLCVALFGVGVVLFIMLIVLLTTVKKGGPEKQGSAPACGPPENRGAAPPLPSAVAVPAQMSPDLACETTSNTSSMNQNRRLLRVKAADKLGGSSSATIPAQIRESDPDEMN